MPGTPGNSGGRRQGRPGRKYTNRSDLRQAPKAVPNQTYGVAGAQLDAQKAIPLSTGPGAGGAGSAPGPSTGAAAAGGGGSVIPLSAPTTRPNEPITAGLPTGPGPGPSTPQDPTLAMLQGAYSILPTPGLLQLIQEAQRGTV